MKTSRRRFLKGATTLALSLGLIDRVAIGQEKNQTRIILLGTRGGPRVGKRVNPSTLLLINDIPYIVDCGYGTSRQLLSAGVQLDRLRYVFITHHHSDHNLEYGSLFYNAWVTGLSERVHSYGPPGLKRMTRDFLNYLQFDIKTRIADEGRPDAEKLIVAHEFDRPGVIVTNDDVKISTGLVRHPPIRHAYAYRFDAKDRSVVISGDTTYAPELATFARGADVLIHEVMYLPGIEALVRTLPNATRLRQHLLDSHTVPEDVGRIAAQAEVKTLVLSHFVPGDDLSITDDLWTADVRKHFKGRIIVGKDLMEI